MTKYEENLKKRAEEIKAIYGDAILCDYNAIAAFVLQKEAESVTAILDAHTFMETPAIENLLKIHGLIPPTHE